MVASPGSGKTTLISSNPEAFVWDSEGRARDVVKCKARWFHSHDLGEFESLMEALLEDGKAGNHPCKHVVLDTVDTLLDQAVPFLSERHGVGDIREMARGKGWFILRDWLMGYLWELSRVGYGWTCCGHIKESILTDTAGNSRVVRSPNIAPSIQSQLFSACHIQATLLRYVERPTVEVKKVNKTTGKEYTVTKKLDPVSKFALNMTPGDAGIGEAKNPYLGYLEESFELPREEGWAEFEKQYDSAIELIKSELAT